MSDIELVIKMPKEQYSLIMQSHRSGVERFIDKETMMYAIKNGTPLPKGHGRLKDIDKIINDGISKGFCDWYNEMKCADTIIEVDKDGNAE